MVQQWPLQRRLRYDEPSLEGAGMGYPPVALTEEQRILAAVIRIEKKVDEIDRRLKSVEQDIGTIKRTVNNLPT